MIGGTCPECKKRDTYDDYGPMRCPNCGIVEDENVE